MSWRDRIDAARAAANTAREAGVELAGEAIENHWPTIKGIIRNRIAPGLATLARDDEIVNAVAGGLHGLLPLPVRLVIRPKRLASWCASNRERIIAAVRQKAEQPPNTGLEPTARE